MNKDFSASTGDGTASSTGGSSPFHQIAALETTEDQRLQVELDAMEKELKEVTKALMEKEEKADADSKITAKAELMKYREDELSMIIQTAESDTKKMVKDLESLYKSKEESLVEELVHATLSYA
jgi:ribosome recycling factor